MNGGVSGAGIWKGSGGYFIICRKFSRYREVHLVEGEKDVDNLRATGLVATTSPGGANNWRPEYAQYLQNKHVVVYRIKTEPVIICACSH